MASQPLDDGSARFWAAAGLGGGSLSDGAAGPAFMAQFVLRNGPHLVRVRGGVVAEIFGDGMADVGLLYGRGSYGPASHASISAGLAVVQVDVCGGLFGGPCRSMTTVGLPVVAEASFRPATFAGLGAQAFANVNPSRSAFGLALFVEVGAVR